MALPDDMIAWKDIATGGAVLVSGVVTYIVNVFTHRLDVHEKQDRETFEKIFDAQTDIANKIATGFRDLDHTVNTIHIKLLERINDVQQSKDARNEH